MAGTTKSLTPLPPPPRFPPPLLAYLTKHHLQVQYNQIPPFILIIHRPFFGTLSRGKVSLTFIKYPHLQFPIALYGIAYCLQKLFLQKVNLLLII